MYSPIKLSLNTSSNSFQLFPNPTSGLFSVHLPSQAIQIDIINTIGEEIQVLKVKNEDELNIEITESGIYFLQIHTDKNILTQKIIVCR